METCTEGCKLFHHRPKPLEREGEREGGEGGREGGREGGEGGREGGVRWLRGRGVRGREIVSDGQAQYEYMSIQS